jgi:dihydroorotate dehydrogenase (NAD+) catalytic subunit
MKFFGKEISGPFFIPSGIVTTEISVLERVAKKIKEIGILTTKSIGLAKREGNKEPILVNFAHLSFLNAVGLTNPGVKEFKTKISQISLPKNKFLLISIFGKDEKEFFKIAKELYQFADGFELNLSCPHAQKFGQVIGQDFELVKRIVKKVKRFKKPVLVKVSPNVNYQKMVKISIRAGADGVVAINTAGPGLYLKDGFPVLSNRVGGISGKAILPIGVKVVSEIRKLGDFPILACGGISNASDILSYKRAGANFFGIGSSLFKMDFEEMKNYFKALNQDFKKGTNLAEKFLHKEIENYQKLKVKKKIFFEKDLFLLELEGEIKAFPGQFVFLWLPEIGEKPFSVFENFPPTFLIRKVGFFTEKLSKIKEGENIYLRGPYGKELNFKGKILLCGGGTGIASLFLFAKSYGNSVIISAKEKLLQEFLKSKFKNYSEKIYAKEFFEKKEIGEIVKKEKPNFILTCGPKGFVEMIIESGKKFLKREKIYFSLDFLTKCGVGLCGSCATKKGLRACVDGPFLKAENFEDKN